MRPACSDTAKNITLKLSVNVFPPLLQAFPGCLTPYKYNNNNNSGRNSAGKESSE